MSLPITLESLLASAPTVTSPEALNALLLSTDGSLRRASVVILQKQTMRSSGYVPGNIDDLVTPGIYALNTQSNFSGTLPAEGHWYEGTLEVIQRNTVTIHRLTDPAATRIAMRRRIGTEPWGAWSVFKPS